MITVYFVGTHYQGTDGVAPLSFDKPGTTEVSPEKAAQLVADFPHMFSVKDAPEAPQETAESAKQDEVPAEVVAPVEADPRPAETKSSKKVK